MKRSRMLFVGTVLAGSLLSLSGVGAGAASSRGVSVAGASIMVPSGWLTKTSTRTVALAPSAKDLSAVVPAQGRLVLSNLNCGSGTSALPSAGSGSVVTVGNPVKTTVGKAKAVSVKFTETLGGRLVTEQDIVVLLSATRAYEIVLEAPSSSWASSSVALHAALATTSFAKSAKC